VRLFGQFDQNLTAIEEMLNVSVAADAQQLVIAGDDGPVHDAEAVVRRMLDAAVNGTQITPHDVTLATAEQRADDGKRDLAETLVRTQRGREIRPRTPGQRRFVEAMASRTLTFGIGPAGTGKTFLAVVMAVRALKARRVTRLVLSRPAVEAGEKLGFLPGDVKEKVDPYLRPLYDALAELLDDATVGKFLDRGTIEIAPLAFMRGRTLSDAFVILDEAQNTTPDQLKMFLTRLGSGSTMVVTGDVTQIDLPLGASSGLLEARTRFAGVDDIAVTELDERDVVRHPLVSRIIRAYAKGS
jgi:phosphate starvation-inducible protein PhoH and related proteins